jgi:hypothetical protein
MVHWKLFVGDMGLQWLATSFHTFWVFDIIGAFSIKAKGTCLSIPTHISDLVKVSPLIILQPLISLIASESKEVICHSSCFSTLFGVWGLVQVSNHIGFQ